jgi:hypothetical protein
VKVVEKIAIEEKLRGCASKVIFKRNGTIEARHSYFYTFGGNADKLANTIKGRLPDATILEVTDEWHAWPKDSYFRVVFTLPEGAK